MTISNCTKCGAPLQEYPILSETHFETLTACVSCQAAVIQQLNTTNAIIAEKCLKTQNVPKRYWLATLTEKYTDFIGSNEVLNGDCGLYLIGDSGIGKSWLTVAWFKYMLYKGLKCHYINWSDFMVQLRMDIKSYEQLKLSALKADCVFIDDFDATNQYMYDIVYNFIGSLYNAPKLVYFNSIELPTQNKLAMRIGEMTKQVRLIRK